MITIAQCRAARGLLDWTQQDLAEASGLSKTAINNFEKGHSDIKAESLRAVRMAFEAGGLEFLDNGVRVGTERAHILRGDGTFDKLLYDMSDSLSGTSSEIMLAWPDDNIRGGISMSRLNEHVTRLKNTGAKIRAITTGEATNQMAQLGIECRILTKPDTEMMTVIYDHKVAVELWNSAAIVIVRSDEANKAEAMKFEQLWSSAKPVSASSKSRNEKAGLF